MNFRTIVGFAAACAVAVLLTAAPAAAQCGPGPHWVDTCAAGTDTMTTHGMVAGIDTDGDCRADVSMILSACLPPQTVVRQAPSDDSNQVQYAGTRPIDDHLDVIDDELTHACMTNGVETLIIGMGQGVGPAGPIAFNTWGYIAEQPADNTMADSIFDVYFELDIGGAMFGYNHAPLRMATVFPDGIDRVPPDWASYYHFVGCLPLFDTATAPGTWVANLVVAEHWVNWPEEPEVWACCDEQDELCLLLTEELCAQINGLFLPGTLCDPDPCRGACCAKGIQCFDDFHYSDCAEPFDVFFPGQTCEEVEPCPNAVGIPAVSEWGLLVMALLGLIAGTIMFRKARARAA